MVTDKFGSGSLREYLTNKALGENKTPILNIPDLLKDPTIMNPIRLALRNDKLGRSAVLRSSIHVESARITLDGKTLPLSQPSDAIISGPHAYQIDNRKVINQFDFAQHKGNVIEVSADGATFLVNNTASTVPFVDGQPMIVGGYTAEGALPGTEIASEVATYQAKGKDSAQITYVALPGQAAVQLVMVKLGNVLIVEPLDTLLTTVKDPIQMTVDNFKRRYRPLDDLNGTNYGYWTNKANFNKKYPDKPDYNLVKLGQPDKEKVIKDLNDLLREKADKHPQDGNS